MSQPPELTRRAILTGIILGILLTPCNIYSGLKIGWSFNMSIASALLSFAFWQTLNSLFHTREWTLLESNINQTTASSAASIISGGLVAPIPALTLLTGQQLPLMWLMIWVFAVSAFGIVVAISLRSAMIVKHPLTFPAGVATAETIQEIYAKGREAMQRVRMMISAALLAAALKLYDAFIWKLPKLNLSLTVAGGGALTGTSGVTLTNLGFVLDPSLLMIGFGAIIGWRAGISLLIGAVSAWGIIGPLGLVQGWIPPGADDPGAYWFAPMVEWLLWPGVTLMVVASLVSFGFAMLESGKKEAADVSNSAQNIPQRFFIAGLILTSALVIWVQMFLFGIALYAAALAVPLSFILAVVAARVVGETGIAPIGAMGKISQLSFGILAPGSLSTNLMTANVAGGAAGQCADLMNDLKTGHLIGANPSAQIIAQVFGILTGSVIGSITYLLLIPDPASTLLTEEWPAPAVATWKAVAEALQQGLHAIPAEAQVAMLIAVIAGILLVIASHTLPEKIRYLVPSAPAMGLAFVLPAWNSLSMFIGALLAFILTNTCPQWSRRFILVIAAGLVAGESLAGIGAAMAAFLGH